MIKKYAYTATALVLIAALVVCGCKAERTKRQKFNLAASAVLNATMFTNPLSAVYGGSGGKVRCSSAGGRR